MPPHFSWTWDLSPCSLHGPSCLPIPQEAELLPALAAHEILNEFLNLSVSSHLAVFTGEQSIWMPLGPASGKIQYKGCSSQPCDVGLITRHRNFSLPTVKEPFIPPLLLFCLLSSWASSGWDQCSGWPWSWRQLSPIGMSLIAGMPSPAGDFHAPEGWLGLVLTSPWGPSGVWLAAAHRHCHWSCWAHCGRSHQHVSQSWEIRREKRGEKTWF